MPLSADQNEACMYVWQMTLKICRTMYVCALFLADLTDCAHEVVQCLLSAKLVVCTYIVSYDAKIMYK